MTQEPKHSFIVEFLGSFIQPQGVADFWAGCFGGSIGIICTQPLDTVRVRMQVGDKTKLRKVVGETWKQEGVRGFFRGVGSPVVTVGLMNAVLFSSFEGCKKILKKVKYAGEHPADGTIMLSISDIGICGAFAGLVTSFITSPTELIKCCVQVQTSIESASVREEARTAIHLARRYGLVHGIGRGLHLTILRDIPSFLIYFTTYETITRKFDPNRERTSVTFLAGGLSGLLSWGAILPMDVLKSQWQTRHNPYPTLLLMVKHQWRYGNAFRGMTATLLRATPQHAITFWGYEFVKDMMSDEEFEVVI